MKTRKFISRFSPNRTAAEDLEKIHVQRHALLDEAVDLVRESARTKNKHHLLFVGARGCGKTHLLALINHRIGKQADLDNRLRIAWLNEDETSTSFLDLLVRIYHALAARFPKEFPREVVGKLFGDEPDKAQEALATSLVSQAGKHTILVIVENLDALFGQLSETDQRSWRSFIQNHPIFATLATAQRLFAGVADHGQPFFGFFDTRHLMPLSADEATELLQKIARLNEDAGLEAFLKTPRGRARIRAIHHLSRGNHRLYVVLSELITAESLDELVRPFEEMVDEQLTPYYQERLRWLSPLQRKIVELLCQRGQPIAVKDIADRLFASHSTITPQLKTLREMGYVVSTPRGRESLYELAEPLMRLSMQVKDTPQAEPLGVIVDFLRVWYERNELEDRLTRADPTERIRVYIQAALAKLVSGEPNLRHELLRSDLEGVDLKNCNDEQVEQMRVLAEETNLPRDWMMYGRACRYRNDYANAVEAFTKAMHEAPAKIVASAAFNRALSYGKLGHVEEMIADCARIVELPSAPTEMVAKALFLRGSGLGTLGRVDEQVADYTKVLDMSGVPENLRARALDARAGAWLEMGRMSDAISDASKVINLPGAPADIVAWALLTRARAYVQTDRQEEAISDCIRVVDLPGALADQVATARDILTILFLDQDRWEAAGKEVPGVLARGDQRLISGMGDLVIEAIFRHFGSPQIWQARVKEAVKLFAEHNALNYFGDALVRHLADLATSPINAEGLKQWYTHWELAAASYETMRLPLRLLRVGIDYLASQPRDEGILLQLPAEERLLLRQALSLPV